MTATTFVSDPTIGGLKTGHKKSYMFSQAIYQVDVYGEDGDYFTCEIMADSCAQATARAEELASEAMVDISYIHLTIMG